MPKITEAVLVAILLMSVAALPGCAASEVNRRQAQTTAQRFEYARVVMGSRARIVVYARSEPIQAVRAAFEILDECDRVLSDYNPNSESMRLAAKSPGVWHDASSLLINAVARSRDVHDASGGAFDITIGPLTSLWRETVGGRPSDDEIADARGRVGFHHLRFDANRIRFDQPGMALDFGGIGKGYAADLALESLVRAGFSIAMVEIGGDLVVGHPSPDRDAWSIRVTDGESTGPTIQLVSEAIATSGDAYRFVEVEGQVVSHIIEPNTGEPTTTGGAVAVIAKRGWVADAVATVARVRSVDLARAAGERLGGVLIIDLEN